MFDPKVKETQIRADLRAVAGDGQADVDRLVTVETDPYAAMRDAHAVVVLTEWGEFREYDYATAYAAMPKPAWIFDGRMVLDHAALKAIGFNVEVIGKLVEAPRSAADDRGVLPSRPARA